MTSRALEKTQGTIFQYHASRSSETAKNFISGFTGIAVTDGYAAYNNIEGITHAECWSHCRRYFIEATPLDKNKKLKKDTYGYIGKSYCDKLFKIEREIAILSVPEKAKERQKRSKPVLDEFFLWAKNVKAKNIIISDKLSKALTYAINQEKELSEFINDGRIPLSNNRAEQNLRLLTIGRKNFLFCDSIAGAKATAVMYSIIESAKMNKLDIYKYLKYLRV